MFGTDTRTEHERYLELELDNYREREERAQQKWQQECRERERERHEHYEYEMRQAESWPDALQKQIRLCRREDAQNPPVDDDDKFFENCALACKRALEIWHVVEASKQPEIDELEQRIEQIRESIRIEVAEKLELDICTEGRQIACALRESSPGSFLDW